MTRLYVHQARVTGFGEFPLDMLRYDACHPATEADTAVIEHSRERRSVNVEQTSAQRHDPWTVGRWSSFGWTIEPLF